MNRNPFEVDCHKSADLLTEIRRWREKAKSWDWRSTPVTDHEIAMLAVESWLGVDRLEEIVRAVEQCESRHSSGCTTERPVE